LVRRLQQDNASILADLAEYPQGLLMTLRLCCVGSCKRLVALPSGIAEATALLKLNAFGCQALQCLPENMGQLKVLQDLDVSQCTSLQALPDSIGGNALSRVGDSVCGVP
jgi:hypothetical protein